MALSEHDQLAYLANIVAVVRADGELSSSESAALEEIRSELGAKKGTFKLALKASEDDSFVPTPVAGLQIKIGNLADMMYVALVDGDPSEAEISLLRRFSETAGLNSDQFKVLLMETQARAASAAGSQPCSKCGAVTAGSAKFCASCGQALAAGEQKSIALSLEIPPTGNAIEFCESSAAGYGEALEFARSAPTFGTCVRGRKNWYLAAWPEKSFEHAIRLAELLGTIRNRRCYHNGVEVPWDEQFGFLWCARERESAYRPVLYCFGKDDNRLNPWGCKQARLEWTEWAGWFSYGRFKSSRGPARGHVWVFDKDRIRHELLGNLHRFRFCPYLRQTLVEAALRAVPDEVEVVDKGPWKYNRAYQEVPGSVKVVEKQGGEGYEFVDEYFADGVRPSGLGVLDELLRRAFTEAGVSDLQPADVLK